MAEITNLKFAQLLKRKLGLKAIDPGRNTTPLVAPTYQLTDSYAPENRGDRGERLFSMFSGESVNSGANGFNMMQVICPTAGRAAVIRRMTFAAQIPTSTNQPGNLLLLAGHNMTSNPQTIGSFALAKDSRAAYTNTLTTGNAVISNVAGATSALIQTSSWGIWIAPQAAILSNFYQVVDNLDIVLWPGNGASFGIRGDTNAVAGWSYFVGVEGYEFTPDASEVSAIPP